MCSSMATASWSPPGSRPPCFPLRQLAAHPDHAACAAWVAPPLHVYLLRHDIGEQVMMRLSQPLFGCAMRSLYQRGEMLGMCMHGRGTLAGSTWTDFQPVKQAWDEAFRDKPYTTHTLAFAGARVLACHPNCLPSCLGISLREELCEAGDSDIPCWVCSRSCMEDATYIARP